MPLKLGPEPKLSDSLHVIILREMWGEFFTLVMANGQTEELDPEETREWFRVRGADMDKLERVLDQAWNFKRAGVEIENPREPKTVKLAHAPNI